tara:strand:+ start:2753 stop:3667 length:915 start_codon:yes stop_codon:yes gene_type:complete
VLENIKTATFVISSNTYPAVRNVRMQKKLFASQANENRKFYWYRQGTEKQLEGKESNLIGDDLFLNIDDDTLSMGKKTIMAFDWALKNVDFDFLIRPTPSSYVNYSNLENYLRTNFLNMDIVYGGKIQETNNKFGQKIQFVSGSTLVLSKKCVEIILENQNDWDHDYWDDVGLAVLMEKVGVNPSGGDRFDVMGNPYKQNIDLTYYQYRCRSDNHYGYPRIIEAHVMNSVHSLFNDKKFGKIKKRAFSFFIELLKFFYVYQFGWKLFTFFRGLLKFILPSIFYKYLKRLVRTKIESFKHKRFKT